MKRKNTIKKILSAILVMTMLLSSSCVLASATESSANDFYNKFYELNVFMNSIDAQYCIIPMPGSSYVDYVEGTREAVKEDIEAADFDVLYEYYTTYGTEAAIEVMDALIEKTKVDIENLYIEQHELEFLIILCKKEQNENGYYQDELWQNFKIAIEQGEKLIADNATAAEIDDAYWQLRHSYNELCSVNTLEGDVNADGVVNVQDIVLLQKYLVGIVDFNSSQKMVGSLSSRYPTSLSVYDLTALQKKCVRIGTPKSVPLRELINKKDYEYPAIFENAIYYYEFLQTQPKC